METTITGLGIVFEIRLSWCCYLSDVEYFYQGRINNLFESPVCTIEANQPSWLKQEIRSQTSTFKAQP